MGILKPLSNFGQRITLNIFADCNVEGTENVPPMGSLIIVSNHQSTVDPSLISTFIPRPTKFLAKKSLFKNPIFSAMLNSYGAFPLDRSTSDARAFRWALKQLSIYQAIVLFPEGTRSLSGLKKANTGVTRLALKSNSAILPIGITGTEKLGSVVRVLNPTGKIRVNIGAPFSLPNIEGRPSKEVLTSLTDMIMERIAFLLPGEYRGVYDIRNKSNS